MDGDQVAQLTKMGTNLYSTKFFDNAIHFLWVYDYLLTFGDEVEYAWKGRRSWVFVLFIGNRYIIVPFLIWSDILLFRYTVPVCRDSKWMGYAFSTLIVVFAQMTIALRIYAVTDKNKWVGGALSAVIAGQLALGTYGAVAAGMSTVLLLPNVDLDPFKVCAYKSSELLDLLFLNIGIAFDVLAFFIIFISARKPRYPGVPSIMDTILRHATVYFVIMFTCQILADLFVIFAPPSFSHDPAIANTVVIPILVSRLMLSLKKESMEQTRGWSLSTMSDAGPLDAGTIQFASQAPRGLRDVLARPTSPRITQEDIELDSVF